MKKIFTYVYNTPIQLYSEFHVNKSLESDFEKHYDLYQHVLRDINNIKKDDINENLCVKYNFQKLATNNDTISTSDMVNKSLHSNVDVNHTSIKMYSNTLDNIWSNLKCMHNVSNEYKAESANYFLKYKQYNNNNTPLSFIDYIKSGAYEFNQNKLSDFINLFDNCLCSNDIPSLINIHTMVELQSTLGSIVSNYSIIQIVGPSAFVLYYFVLNDSNNLKYIIKKCLYNQQTQLNFKNYKYLYNFLNIITIPSIFILYQNLNSVNTAPVIINSTLNIDGLKANIIKNGSKCIPTMEKDPILYFFRNRACDITFGITDIALNAIKGVYKAYLANLCELNKTISETVKKHE